MSTHYKVVIYNPHMDETAVEDWCIKGAVGSEERVMTCDRLDRHIESAKGQNCEVSMWSNADYARGWWHMAGMWQKGDTIHDTMKRRWQRRQTYSSTCAPN